jgi:hypothetical protein
MRQAGEENADTGADDRADVLLRRMWRGVSRRAVGQGWRKDGNGAAPWRTGGGVIAIAYDVKLKRPGCVLIAAVMGTNTHVPDRFPIGSWLLAPTPDMKRYLCTEEEVEKLVEITRLAMERSRQDEKAGEKP